MIELIPPPMGTSLGRARKLVRESLGIVEEFVRENDGEPYLQTIRLRFLLIAALEHIEASEKHRQTVLSTIV